MKRPIRLLAIILTITLLLSACDILHFPEPTDSTYEADNVESGLTVYFIDVGQAESALIVCCHGSTMMIDGGNVADSDLIYTFLNDRGITHLDYVVATHGHEDHVGGLSAAVRLATVGVALSPVTEYDSRAFNNFVQNLDDQGVSITVPSHGDAFALGGAEVLIVGPVQEYRNHNDMSLVMLITYGETSFLFTGDAEHASELDIIEAGYDISATVLSVSHHGSDTSTSYPFLREVSPEFAVISCARNNQYGHPSEDVLSRLHDADVVLYRTDMQGTITAYSDGMYVSFSVERNENIDTNPDIPPASEGEPYYIGNTNSRIFHRPSCSGLPSEQNRIILDSLEMAFTEGYTSCGRCNP